MVSSFWTILTVFVMGFCCGLSQFIMETFGWAVISTVANLFEYKNILFMRSCWNCIGNLTVSLISFDVSRSLALTNNAFAVLAHFPCSTEEGGLWYVTFKMRFVKIMSISISEILWHFLFNWKCCSISDSQNNFKTKARLWWAKLNMRVIKIILMMISEIMQHFWLNQKCNSISKAQNNF